jgi:hypothetical protein
MPDDGRKPRRLQSQTERDLDGAAARREREGVPVETWDEDCTGKHADDPDALRAARSKRPTDERIGHVEERVDGVVQAFGEMRAEVATGMGKMEGAIGTLAGEVKGLATVVASQSQRDHVTFTSKVEVDTAQKTAQVEVGKAKAIDAIDAKKSRRELAIRIVAVAAVIAEILRQAGVL